MELHGLTFCHLITNHITTPDEKSVTQLVMEDEPGFFADYGGFLFTVGFRD